jgi:glycosyltransferase involved in cell wall biosynthesis
MRRCDVVVHASLREPFGLVVAEAMASGSAVIASNTIGPAEIIEPGRNGLLTEPGDVEGLRDALTGLLVDAALRDRLARAGRQRILERFDLRRSLEGLFSLTLGRASIDEGDGQSTSSLGARRADADR